MAGSIFQPNWKHFGITLGLLWDRFGITFGLLPVATNNASGLVSLKPEAFSTNSRMWLGTFFNKTGNTLGSLWDCFGIASGSAHTCTFLLSCRAQLDPSHKCNCQANHYTESNCSHFDPNHRTLGVPVIEWLREVLCIFKYPREDTLVRHVCHIGDAVSADASFECGFGDLDAIH